MRLSLAEAVLNDDGGSRCRSQQRGTATGGGVGWCGSGRGGSAPEWTGRPGISAAGPSTRSCLGPAASALVGTQAVEVPASETMLEAGHHVCDRLVEVAGDVQHAVDGEVREAVDA